MNQGGSGLHRLLPLFHSHLFLWHPCTQFWYKSSLSLEEQGGFVLFWASSFLRGKRSNWARHGHCALAALISVISFLSTLTDGVEMCWECYVNGAPSTQKETSRVVKKHFRLQKWLFIEHLLYAKGFLGGTVLKNPPVNAGNTRDVGSIPGLGISPGIRNDNSLQYSCLENPTGRGAWQATVHRVAKSKARLNDWTHTHSMPNSRLSVFLQLSSQ